MKLAPIACLTLLLLTAGGLIPALAANPLSPAEKTVCRNLSHCLSILDRHPHDSFDYVVLAEEFARFGGKGRKALLRRVEKGDQGRNRSASHAADLLAMMQDADALPTLDALSKRDQSYASELAARTHQALTARLHNKSQDAVHYSANTPHAACAKPTNPRLAAQKDGMPYFELNVATPDDSGAYRPSAPFRIDRPLSTRDRLRSAVSIQGGWYAAYPDSLTVYDSRTGAANVRLKACVLSVQRQSGDSIATTHVWAFIAGEANQTRIMDVGPDSIREIMRLPGIVSSLNRQGNGALCASTRNGMAVTLKTDGTVRSGCLQDSKP